MASRSTPVGFALWLALGLLAAPLALATPPQVVMVSLDGTRPADVTVEDLPALVDLAERGLRAERLVPAFPTNTFPNHVTLATGVSPGRHGIVDNSFIDPERGPFDRSDIPSWIRVEPIWALLEARGIPTASYYWVGSEGGGSGAAGQGLGPRYWKPFDKRTPERDKVEQILAWLDLPEGERPRLITSWFHGADSAGHDHGPGTPEVRAALVSQNAAVAALVRAFDERGLWESTTLVVVSDHGMAAPPGRADLPSALEAAGVEARVLGIGGFAKVVLERRADAARAVEVAREMGLQAWAREDAPARLGVSDPRFGDVVALAPADTAISRPGLDIAGFHGYPSDDPEMAALFVAAGRGMPRGAVIESLRAVDVAPTVLALFGVEAPAWMEGRALGALDPPGGMPLQPAPASATLAPAQP